MRKVLEINLYVTYTGMLRDRNRLVGIMSDENFMPWYIQNFIPLIMYETGSIHCYDTTNFYEVFELYDEVMDIHRVNQKQNNIESLEAMIMGEQYILAFCDQYFLEGSIYYKEEHKYSEILIYGFDSENEEIFFHTSQLNGKDYDCGICKYGNYMKAVENSYSSVKELESDLWQICFGHPVSCFKLKHAKSQLNIRKVFYHFNNLLNGRNILISNENGSSIYKTGVLIFDGLEEICSVIKYGNVDKYTKAVWCVKLLANYIANYNNIMDYLNKEMNIAFHEELYEECTKLSQTLRGVYALLQKFVLTGSSRDLERVTLIIPEAKMSFVSVVERINQSLRQYILCD